MAYAPGLSALDKGHGVLAASRDVAGIAGTGAHLRTRVAGMHHWRRARAMAAPGTMLFAGVR